MVSLEDQYYDINRKLLMMSGLWPYQNWWFRIIQNTLFLFSLFSFMIVQLTIFLKFKVTIILIIRVTAQVCPCLVYVLKYSSFLFNLENIKQYFERIHREWTTLKCPDEINILRKYAGIFRLFALTLTALLFSFLVVFVLFQFVPNVLDIIAPLNKSRKHHLPYVIEYFVDQEQYFYPILAHGMIAISAGGVGVITAGITLLGYILHICAMLKIASYRLEHISDKLPLISNSEKDHIVYEKIISAIDIHRRAIDFAESILSNFKIFYLLLICVGISSLTINLYQFLQFSIILGDTNDANGMISCGLLIIAHFFYLFLANFCGQIITDHNIDIFHTTCATRWYKISLQAQRLLLLILRKNTKNYYFVIGGIFVASLEGFATLTSMSISYFMVICSTRR